MPKHGQGRPAMSSVRATWGQFGIQLSVKRAVKLTANGVADKTMIFLQSLQ